VWKSWVPADPYVAPPDTTTFNIGISVGLVGGAAVIALVTFLVVRSVKMSAALGDRKWLLNMSEIVVGVQESMKRKKKGKKKEEARM
jgi:hypothetical protein